MNESIPSLVTSGEMPQDQKPELSGESELYKLLAEYREEILSTIKWSLVQQDKLPNVPKSDERVISFIEGNLKGMVAEKLSVLLGFDNVETVFKSDGFPGMGFSLEALETLSPGDYVGSSNRKADIISTALKNSLEDKPLGYRKGKDDSEIVSDFKESRRGKPYLPKEQYGELLRFYIKTTRKKLSDALSKINEDLLEDYKSPPRNAPLGYDTFVGEMFRNTVIPDAFIIKKGEKTDLVGLVEVKAYTPDELATLIDKIKKNEGSQESGTRFKVTGTAYEFGKIFPGAEKVKFNMGFDINKEVGFVDFIRGVSKGESNRYEQNIVVLRFPKDIPNNLLSQFGQLIVDYGYPNVVIQKLPFSNQDLIDISRRIVNDTFSDVWLQRLKMNFSDKEIALLDTYRKI